MRLACRLVPWVIAILLSDGCSQPQYDVAIGFANDVTPTDVRFIELLLLPQCPSAFDVVSGQAPSGTIIRGVGLRQAEAASLPGLPDVKPGVYGLYARGFNASCTAVAAGCVAVSLEGRGGKTLSVELGATTRIDACASDICNDGRCVFPDGGSGYDAGTDSGTDGGTDVDACLLNPCASNEFCTDLGPPAPSDASGRLCTAVRTCGMGEYQSAAPTPTSDRVCGTCAVCNAGQFETTACANGNAEQNRTCKALTSCGPGQYVTTDPTPTSDRICSPCTTCGPTQYETVGCANGNTTQNRVCTSLTNCTTGEYQSQEPTAISNRTCATCVAPCGSGTYQSQDCANGNSMQNRICSQCDASCIGRCSGPTSNDCTNCPSGQYWTGSVCANLTDCGSNQYQTSAPTPTSDRVCASCATCGAGQYESQA